VPVAHGLPRDDARRERLAEFAARAATCALFVFFATQIAAEYAKTGHVTGLLLLVSELLVVALTVVRRPAAIVDRTLGARIVATTSMVGIPLLRPTGIGLVPDLYTAIATGLGLSIIIAAKATLGRSFGLMPANRGIVNRGIYRAVRHPIYAGYLVTHAAFLVAHPTWWNAALILVSDSALLVRALYEERTLALDEAYAAYMARVRWRVLPGCF
jgi:protein-S-isoprenylcysteine O-methyltransferase Ste14